MPDPKRQEKPPPPADKSRETLVDAFDEPEENGDSAEKIEEKGEPFDGNFA